VAVYVVVPIRLTLAPAIPVPLRSLTATMARPWPGENVPGGGVTRLTSSTVPFVALEVTADVILRFAAVLVVLEQLIGPPWSVTQATLDVTV
jgi:hypothetical protein